MIIKTECRMGNLCVIRAGGKPDDECTAFCYYNTRVLKTMADKIRSMSDEDLAEYLAALCERMAALNTAVERAPDKACWIEWLRAGADGSA